MAITIISITIQNKEEEKENLYLYAKTRFFHGNSANGTRHTAPLAYIKINKYRVSIQSGRISSKNFRQ